MVCAGRLAVVLATPDGRELVINEMRAGELCGELALFPGHTHTASAVARQAGFVAAIPSAQFLTVLESQPRLMRRLLEVLANRLRASTERESALAFLTAPARLARLMLMELEADAPVASPEKTAGSRCHRLRCPDKPCAPQDCARFHRLRPAG